MSQRATRILVLHAKEMIAEALALALSSDPRVETEGICTGLYQDPIAIVRDRQPDVVLLEYGSEGASGIEVTRRVVKNCEGVKVLVLDVPENETDILAVIESGASGYETSGAPLSSLASNISALLRGEAICSPRIAALLFSCAARASARKETGRLTRSRLTFRELQVIKLIEAGLTNKEVARAVDIVEEFEQAAIEFGLPARTLRISDESPRARSLRMPGAAVENSGASEPGQDRVSRSRAR